MSLSIGVVHLPRRRLSNLDLRGYCATAMTCTGYADRRQQTDRDVRTTPRTRRDGLPTVPEADRLPPVTD